MKRGQHWLAGDAWGNVLLTPLGAGTSWLRSGNAAQDARDAAVFLDELDALVASLHSNERALFYWGYDASVAADARLSSSLPHGFVDAWCGRCTIEQHDSATHNLQAAPVVFRPSKDARPHHHQRVEQARAWLLDGVIYQANLAHRLYAAPHSFDDGVAFFQHRIQPQVRPACAALVDFPGHGSLVSLSPERFLTFDLGHKHVATHPIKGTRPRHHNATTDAAQQHDLAHHHKDLAEHVMIVDLLRNDLSRVCEPGSVTVTALMEPLTTSSVHHLESTIEGTLQHDITLGAMLGSMTPGGSITGVPKRTAIEAIAAFEDGPRGPYTGVLGVVDAHGVGMSSLLIRTWLRRDESQGELWVGGGVVVNSDPEAEWQETLDKAAAFGAVKSAAGA
jgi:anthranilate/para-aminobenzoate synthase component I